MHEIVLKNLKASTKVIIDILLIINKYQIKFILSDEYFEDIPVS